MGVRLSEQLELYNLQEPACSLLDDAIRPSGTVRSASKVRIAGLRTRVDGVNDSDPKPRAVFNS